MIQQESLLKVIDNSGAKIVKCIKILGKFKKRYANLGDIIVVSIKQLRNKLRNTSKVKKKSIFKALIVRVKNQYQKYDGSKILLSDNAVVLIDKQNNPVGTRIVGPIAKKLKKKKFVKFLNISSGFI